MISVSEAKEFIVAHTMPLPSISLPIEAAGGLVLAEDVVAGYDIPAYPQSSMDGYAFAFADAPGPLRVVAELAAGSSDPINLGPGNAVRIFTGAALPTGADTILVQEKATVRDGFLHLPPEGMKQADHVRPPGSEIMKGEVALPKHTELKPPAIGFLAAIGVARVNVIPPPRIMIVVTGNELIRPGEDITLGKVYEASSYALQAVLQSLQLPPVKVLYVKDDPEAMRAVLADALQEADLVLMTGGVSVGDHDHTVSAAVRCGVQPVFHKVKQKPGKPLFFGVKDEKCFFGLPGNPSSVLTCFYEYVLPCLSRMTGRKLNLPAARARLGHDLRKPKGLTHFLRAVVQDGMVHTGAGQESYKLRSFALSNCLLVLPEEVESAMAGSEVDIHVLPG